MGQVINTNSLSLLTQNNLNKSQGALNSAIERLSSGMRINSAKDDAAGQAIANRFTANIRGLTQAQRNANDGISIAQTTEGALNETNNNLQRVRELSVQATNGSNSKSDLASIQAEIKQRMAEIDRTAAQTDFNGVKVLSKDSTLSIQVGANDGETIGVTLKKIDGDALSMRTFSVSGPDGTGTSTNPTVVNFTDAGFAKSTAQLTKVDAALTQVDSLRGTLGAVQSRFESVISNLGTTITNLASSRSRIEDADYAVEVSNMTRANILQQAGTSVLAQANQSTQGVLSLLR